MVNVIIRKFSLTQKTVAALTALALILSSICVTVVNTDRQSAFTPRFSAPLYSNHYYYSDNIFYKSGYGIPNCTAYAWGRAYEITGNVPKLCTGDAGQWFEYNKANGFYDYGTEPKLGAVACFDNEYGGHVAVVEQITSDTITFSNSAYGGKSFYLSETDIDDENPGQDGWTFQGYVYLGNFKSEAEPSSSLYKVTAQNGLNLRSSATTYCDIVCTIPYNTQLYISAIYKGDDYSWGYTSYNGIQGYCAVDYTEKIT